MLKGTNNNKLYSYTVFIDILGYSNKIKEVSTTKEANEIFDLLDNIELAIKEYFEVSNSSTSHKEYNMHYTFFSDCIILSFVPKDNLNIDENEIISFNQTTLEFIFTWIINIQFIALLKTGFLLRGGISIKDIYWDKNNKVVGPALIEAYNLESKSADWARIILSEDLSNDTSLIKNINYFSTKYIDPYLPHTLILKDENEKLCYYNYIGRMLSRLNINNINELDEGISVHIDSRILKLQEQITLEYFIEVAELTEYFIAVHKKIIEDNLNNKDEKIKNKYIKIKEYHNYALEDFIFLNDDFIVFNDLLIK